MADIKVTIVDRVDEPKTRKDNKFDSLIATLLNAGEGKQANFDVEEDKVEHAKKWIREAANFAERTARISVADTAKDDVKRMSVWLIERQYRQRKDADDAEDE